MPALLLGADARFESAVAWVNGGEITPSGMEVKLRRGWARIAHAANYPAACARRSTPRAENHH
jgi:hypothetical protein